MAGPAPQSGLPPLARPVATLSGVGPERSALLAKLEIQSVEDLLLHRPRRYEDRQKLLKIAELQLREPAITHGKIVALGTKWFRKRSKSIFEIIVEDGTARLHCRWWNLPFMEKYFSVGKEVLVFGKPLQLKPRTIDHPETEILEPGEENFIHLNRLTPIYGLTEGLGQRWLRALIWRTLHEYEGAIEETWPAAGHDLPSRAQAIRQTHFPESSEQIELGRKRLALDELVQLQLQIQTRRRNFQSKSKALPCGGDNRLIKPFLKQLRYHLTASQTKVLREIRGDMSGAHPMRRLLQGDVGSGKTVVAACTALMAVEAGYEVALMAPTEILAEQHAATFGNWFRSLGIPVQLRTSSHTNSEPDAVIPVSDGVPRATRSRGMFIGTHALIESAFVPDNLGLVIIDEQHKFGVAQREKLLRKGVYPHLLVMTATPIPRTLGLTLYGDLDVSTIDELPPGRGRIKTFVRGQKELPKVREFIRAQLGEGKQAYVVCPHVEETGQPGIKAVGSELKNLQSVLAPFKVGMIHGRLGWQEKAKVMGAFRAGELQVLLATSVIEVGVDIPNATMMLVENADQFGLAQLHQLRGRIGRGAQESFCILVADRKTQAAQARLKVLEQTNDGFELAEADLRLRGPGEMLGQAQSGMPRFRFGNLVSDLDLIKEAREIARKVLDSTDDRRMS
jgi:ATP-dependent DNA helicase RecG